MKEERKTEASKVKQTNKAKQHSTPKAVTFPMYTCIHVHVCTSLCADSHQVVSSGQKDYFQMSDELSRENSHFALSEALLSVIEQVYVYM